MRIGTFGLTTGSDKRWSGEPIRFKHPLDTQTRKKDAI